MTAFEQGWRDAECGRSLRDCPFMPGGFAIAWRSGFRAFYAAFDSNLNG